MYHRVIVNSIHYYNLSKKQNPQNTEFRVKNVFMNECISMPLSKTVIQVLHCMLDSIESLVIKNVLSVHGQ